MKRDIFQIKKFSNTELQFNNEMNVSLRYHSNLNIFSLAIFHPLVHTFIHTRVYARANLSFDQINGEQSNIFHSLMNESIFHDIN